MNFKILCPDEVAKNLLISEFIEDLEDIEHWHVTELINKWKEKRDENDVL